MRKTFLPPARIARGILATVALIGPASTAWADTQDYNLTSTTYIDSDFSTQNMGGETAMKNVVNATDHDGGSVTRSLLALPAIVVPPQDAGDVITSVTLNLYCSWYSPPSPSVPTTFSMVAYPLTQGFVQGNGDSSNGYNANGATWFTYDGTHDWTMPSGGTTSGGAFDSSVSVALNAAPVMGQWDYFNLTNLWTSPSYATQQREMQNYGVELTVSPENPNLVSAGSWVTEEFANDNYTPPPASPGPYLAVTFTPVTAVWNGFSSNWSNTAAWNPATPPNAMGAVAEFGNATQNQTVTVDSPVTVGTIIFSNSADSYTLIGGGSNSITMSSLSGEAAITVNHGTHKISAPIVLASNTMLTVADATDTLTLNGGISGTGTGLTLEGSGTLILSGSDTYSGGTTVNGGILEIETEDALPAGQALTINAGGTLIFNPAAGAPLALSAGPQVAAVPEPGTLALLIAGLAVGSAAWRRRRRDSHDSFQFPRFRRIIARKIAEHAAVRG